VAIFTTDAVRSSRLLRVNEVAAPATLKVYCQTISVHSA
jgi:hypothetical protein